MHISKIIIENYRSIKRAEIDPAKFSVFVGQNNHGKTNFFEAIEWFYNAKSTKDDEHYQQDTSNTVKVEIHFDDVAEQDIDKLKAEASKTKIRNLLGDATSFCILKTSVNNKREYIVEGENKGNPQGLDTAINEFIPKLEYVNTKIRLEDVSSYKAKNPIGAMLSGVLAVIIESSEDYQKFKEEFERLFDDSDSEVRKAFDDLGSKVEIYLQKQFPDGTQVKFKVNQPDFSDLLKSFDTLVYDGIETKAEDKGDGMQRALMLSIIQAFADYRKEQVGGGNFLFLIDEAELHLHPSAQRLLKRALLDIAEVDQVLINTHSSVFVADNHELQKIFKVEKHEGTSDITEIIDDNDRMDIIYELLGGSPADLLLPRNFLIVEGKSEFTFIKEVIKRFYGDRYQGIKIIFAGGDLSEQEPSLHAVHKLFSPLASIDNPIYKNRSVVLIDKPNSEQMNKYNLFKSGYPYLFANRQVFELPTESLEEYYPEPFKKEKGELQSSDKVPYAREVANNISKEQFEDEMNVIYDALERARELRI